MIFLQQVGSTFSYTGLWLDLLRSLLALVFVCALIVVSLRFLARRGLLGAVVGGGTSASLSVLQRIALEPRKHLYLVRAGKRVLLIATGDSGAPRLLAELEPDAIEGAGEAAPAKTSSGDG